MSHEQGSASLWRGWIRLYQQSMAKTLYNLRLLADSRLREGRFEAFLDGYAASIDIDPVCHSPRRQNSAEAIWADFVRVSMDANAAIKKNLGKPSNS